MMLMNRPIQNPAAGPPRRFLLLPEEATDAAGRDPRVRRYRLTSIGRRSGSGLDLATARLVSELGRLGHMHG
jgi:hypothetical protein